jgi:hypothetical protein
MRRLPTTPFRRKSRPVPVGRAITFNPNDHLKRNRRVHMKDHLKALAGHFRKNADSHRAQAACHCGLSECAKAAGFFKGDRQDFHHELATQHGRDAERCDKIAAHCEKAAALPADSQGGDGRTSDVELNLTGDSSAKAATEQLDGLLQKDRTAEMLKAGAAANPIDDSIAALTHELAL